MGGRNDVGISGRIDVGMGGRNESDFAEFLPKLHLDHKIVPRLLYHLLERQKTETSLRQLLATYPDGMVVVNIEGVVLFANPAASDLFGRPISDLIDHHLGFPVVGDDPVEIEIAGRRVAEMRVVKINWMEQSAYLTSLRDITHRKQLENELIEAKAAAESSNIAKTQFLACMSHELRTPLNSIIGFSEILTDGTMCHDKESCHEYLDIIHTSGKHLLSIVNDVLDVAAVESGKTEIECEILDVNLIVGTSLKIIAQMADKKGVKLHYQQLPFMMPLYADFRRVRQIVINLLSNAIKYTPKGGKITVACSCDQDGSIYISVEDTGIGISPENLLRVMMPFTHVGDPYTSPHQGSGLGLYITKVMVELHGGTLKLLSEVKKGTKAIVRFPPERVVTYRA